MNAIEFDHVGKQYRLGLVSTGTFSHDLNRWWTMNVRHKEDPNLKIGETNDRSHKGESNYVWALKDINFNVEQGDVVGIIGKNGAGKSTLLKLLSRVTTPTVGEIRARGRIASLLEVGTGFHPEMTGRENIYMNGAIMGMTKAEISRKLDEIVDFSGCERYIDTPVKRYSSGMTVRLGFAIAAHLEPEILVVDEVLAVGDAEFQKKAIGKMQDVSRGQGRTVLFVSHNMNSVRHLCNKGVVIENGSICFEGNVNDAVDFYTDGENMVANDKIIVDSITYKASFLQIDSILFNGTSNINSTLKQNQEMLEVVIEGSTKIAIKADLVLTFKNLEQTPLAFFSTAYLEGELSVIPKGRFRLVKKIRLPKYLCAGQCVVSISMIEPNVEWHFYIPNVMLNIEGCFGKYGKTILIKEGGLIGFESFDQ